MLFIGSSNGPIRSEYTGLDRFGRVDEQNWYNTSTSTSIVDIQYGYDDDGNVLYQNNTLESTQSELFTYDNLGQLTSYEQGTLSDDNTVIASPSITETWGYDPLGNHLTDTTNSVTITSTFNYDNQITSISSGTTPTYDADGNMTQDQSGLTYTYDAWGHEIDVYSGMTLEESYSYDGRGFRMTNTVYTDDVGTTTNLYNSTDEQVLEEQAAGTGYYTARYVWSQNYVNQMVDRDTDTSGTGLTASGDGYSRVWPVADTDFNTVALVVMSDGSATVEERYAYDPFGTVTYMTGSYGSESNSAYSWVYLFQGGRLDTITGGTNFDARNENSALGTWTSEDPLGFGGGLDFYLFTDNDPASYEDWTGLEGEQWQTVSFSGQIQATGPLNAHLSQWWQKILGTEITYTGEAYYRCTKTGGVELGPPPKITSTNWGPVGNLLKAINPEGFSVPGITAQNAIGASNVGTIIEPCPKGGTEVVWKITVLWYLKGGISVGLGKVDLGIPDVSKVLGQQTPPLPPSPCACKK